MSREASEVLFPFFDLKTPDRQIVYKGDVDDDDVEVPQYRRTFGKWLQMHVVTKTVFARSKRSGVVTRKQ